MSNLIHRSSILLAFLFVLNQFLCAQPGTLVTYAGSSGKEAFFDVVQLSDGSFLVGGSAEDLGWIDSQIPVNEIPLPGVTSAQGNNQFAILLHFDSTLQTLIQVVHFPQGSAEDVRFIKTTNIPGEPTGSIYISGNTEDTKQNNGGYFIARLNDNFVNGVPTAVDWAFPIWAEGYPKTNHPWDVSSQGKVTYVRGQSHDYDWSAAYRLNANGEQEVVPGWRQHWVLGGGEYKGVAAAYPNGGIDSLSHSGIVFKRDGRCNLRSWNSTDYNTTLPDGNGGTKKGMWPLDAFYTDFCDPNGSSNTSGPGYSGYSPGATFIHGPSSIVIDRRTDAIYLGMNIKSVLPSNLPDFEPAVIAMDSNGSMQWWSRLYHEITPAGDTMNSTPDQYIDGLAVDYSQPASDAFLVVNGRCHGNNVENFWEGNSIAANPNAAGFQNRFTGTSGNIHISWLGKLKMADGTLFHSTYVAEYAEGTGGLGSPHPDPNLDGWPNPNGGWPDVNTTRLARNSVTVTADGSVSVLGTGRRTITTANAYQKMVKPGNGGLSSWNQFVRVYTPDLNKPLYSSLVVGAWDTLTQQGGENTTLYGQFKTREGVVAVGLHQEDSQNPGVAKGNDIPVTNVPAWGAAAPQGQSAILVHYTAAEITNPDDSPVTGGGTTASYESWDHSLSLYPNPAQDQVIIRFDQPIAGTYHVQIYDLSGAILIQQSIDDRQTQLSLNTAHLAQGTYLVRVRNGHRQWHKRLLIQ